GVFDLTVRFFMDRGGHHNAEAIFPAQWCVAQRRVGLPPGGTGLRGRHRRAAAAVREHDDHDGAGMFTVQQITDLDRKD
ncbi:hypothetical protein XF35_38735, partial [Streptomyces platensis subsp. clarensis]|nr:hypothetical protein [Streptomyces platensis subsp. clarensis]